MQSKMGQIVTKTQKEATHLTDGSQAICREYVNVEKCRESTVSMLAFSDEPASSCWSFNIMDVFDLCGFACSLWGAPNQLEIQPLF